MYPIKFKAHDVSGYREYIRTRDERLKKMEEEKNAALGLQKPSKKLGGRPEGARKALAVKAPRKAQRSRGGELNFFTDVNYRNHKDALARQRWLFTRM